MNEVLLASFFPMTVLIKKKVLLSLKLANLNNDKNSFLMFLLLLLRGFTVTLIFILFFFFSV